MGNRLATCRVPLSASPRRLLASKQSTEVCMKRISGTLWATLSIAGALTLAASSPAEAALLLAANVGGSLYCAADNVVAGVCAGGGTFLPDLDADLGQLDLGNQT